MGCSGSGAAKPRPPQMGGTEPAVSMGGTASSMGGTASSSEDRMAPEKTIGDSFRNKYTFGEELGKGGNAAVMLCHEIGTGKEYAVKLLEIGKATVDLDQEVRMMKLMDGCEYAVQLKDVFMGAVFAYIVMDRYHGDVVHAMVLHIAKNGKCSEAIVRPLFRQMVAAIAWLHNKDLIHRDVKSDNYLLDRPNVAEAGVKVVLSDMGTVQELPQDQFLSARVGTALYWSPEVVRKKYSYPADVWALGVVLYSILLGLFPFRGPEQLLSDAEPNYTRAGTTLSKSTQEYLSLILTKKVDKRMTAQEALDHSWQSATSAGDSGSNVRIHANLATKVEHKPEGKDGILKRVQEKEKAGASAQGNLKRLSARDIEPFTTMEGSSDFNWEWWPESQLGGMLGSRKGFAETQNMRTMETTQWTKHTVVDLFEKRGIDVSKYGVDKANSIDQMVKELTTGESVLLQEEAPEGTTGKLVRVVQVVLLRLKNLKTQQLLIETELDMGDGRKKTVNRLMGTKMKPDENLKSCARRILRDYLSMDSQSLRAFCRLHAAQSGGTSDSVTLQCERIEEGPMESPAYPGMNTVYHKYFLDGDVDPSSITAALKRRYNLEEVDGIFTLPSQLNDTRTWAWKSHNDCQTLGIATKGGKRADEVGFKLRSVTMTEWTMDQVTRLLQKYNVDTSKFGMGKALPIQKLVDEINRGEAALLEQQQADLSSVGDGVKTIPLVRVTDIVVLRLRLGDDSNRHLLVEASHTLTDGRQIITNRLPATKMKAGETVWAVGRRLIDGKLMLKDADISIRTGFEDIVDEEAESPSYPGLPTLYRKHFIDATMNVWAS